MNFLRDISRQAKKKMGKVNRNSIFAVKTGTLDIPTHDKVFI